MLPPIARRFVAGESTAAALEHSRDLNHRRIGAMLNLLGEHYDDADDPVADVEAYRDLLEGIDAAGVRACLSVKPSQLGLLIDESLFMRHARSIVEAAAVHDGFVWFDMENHETTDPTLDAFETLATAHPGRVGVCLQANLRRTAADLDRLAGVDGKLRLVKGAYDEPAEIAFVDRRMVNRRYRELLQQAFQEHDHGIAVGSHDPVMIDHAISLHETHGTDFEIQMLMGVREDAQTTLAGEHSVWQYVPFGNKWLSYFWRRVTERKENVLFALRALVGR